MKRAELLFRPTLNIDDEVITQRGLRELEDLIINREYTSELILKIRLNLSRFENQVIKLYLDGLPYSEIAERLNKPEKSVDNAVQRVRRKLILH